MTSTLKELYPFSKNRFFCFTYAYIYLGTFSQKFDPANIIGNINVFVGFVL